MQQVPGRDKHEGDLTRWLPYRRRSQLVFGDLDVSEMGKGLKANPDVSFQGHDKSITIRVCVRAD